MCPNPTSPDHPASSGSTRTGVAPGSTPRKAINPSCPLPSLPTTPTPKRSSHQAWLVPGPFPKHATAHTDSPLGARCTRPSCGRPQVGCGASDAGDRSSASSPHAAPTVRRERQPGPALHTPRALRLGRWTAPPGGSRTQTGTLVLTPVLGLLPEQRIHFRNTFPVGFLTDPRAAGSQARGSLARPKGSKNQPWKREAPGRWQSSGRGPSDQSSQEQGRGGAPGADHFQKAIPHSEASGHPPESPRQLVEHADSGPQKAGVQGRWRTTCLPPVAHCPLLGASLRGRDRVLPRGGFGLARVLSGSGAFHQQRHRTRRTPAAARLIRQACQNPASPPNAVKDWGGG